VLSSGADLFIIISLEGKEAVRGVIEMKKLIWLIVIGILITACADDIIVKSISELRGAYVGEYIRVKSVSSGAQTKTQGIKWTFTDQKFFCEVTDTVDIWLCDFSGNYKLENKLILSDTVVGAQTCDRNEIPVGSFDLRRASNPDSLIIKQYIEPPTDVEKIILLVAEPVD
jgi:hypothetical protein